MSIQHYWPPRKGTPEFQVAFEQVRDGYLRRFDTANRLPLLESGIADPDGAYEVEPLCPRATMHLIGYGLPVPLDACRHAWYVLPGCRQEIEQYAMQTRGTDLHESNYYEDAA